MKPYNFDEHINRRGSGSYKWDSDSEDNSLPMWVADMDFRTAPSIIEALRQRVEHGIFGYVRVPDEYYTALCSWFENRHGWIIDRNHVIYTSGVVPALSAIIKAMTKPGDGVIIQTPAYNCFFSSIRNNGCRIVSNPLRRIELSDGFSYELDFTDLELKASDPHNTVMLLCNPHNPSGRVWTPAELARVAEICHRHDVRIISDEIHCELTMPEMTYHPFATVDPSAIVCCSPSKAFNIAGLQIANIIAPDSDTRDRIDKAININEVCDVNPFGATALIAAYEHGGQWLDDLKEYLYGNWQCLSEYFAMELPEFPVCRLQATYLAWIDISVLGLTSDEVATRIANESGVRINPGSMYGQDGYIRINFACPRDRMTEGLQRISSVLRRLIQQ